MNGANPADGIIRNLPMEKINFSSDGNMDIEKRAKTHGDRNELPHTEIHYSASCGNITT